MQQTITKITTSLTNTDCPLETSVLKPLLAIVKKTPRITAQCTLTALADPSSRVRKAALKLFSALVNNGQAIQEATIAATNAIASPKTHKEALSLFATLAANHQPIKEAFPLAITVLKGPNDPARSEAVKLLENLIEKGQSIDIIIQNITEAATNTTNHNQIVAYLHLFFTLVKHGYAYRQAKKITAKTITHLENNSHIPSFINDHILTLNNRLIAEIQRLENTRKITTAGQK